jgi:hypothetical protein
VVLVPIVEVPIVICGKVESVRIEGSGRRDIVSDSRRASLREKSQSSVKYAVR